MTLKEEKLEEMVNKEVEDLFQSFNTEKKEILMVIQFHLRVEQIIERILLASLERGDKLLDNAGLSFHQKLCIIEALNALDSRYVDALRKLNKLRNTCAHVNSSPINKQEIDKIGRCLGRTYTEILRDTPASDHLSSLIILLFAKIGSHMISRTLTVEHPNKENANSSSVNAEKRSA
jgi:hypothetical protein